MSIARTLDGKLSATLALITIVGWLVVAVVNVYPAERPDIQMTAIVIGLAIVAYKFYSMDKTTSKDPEMQKAQIEASVEIFLDKLAKHQAAGDTESEQYKGLKTLLDLFRGFKALRSESEEDLPKVVSEEIKPMDYPTYEAFNEAIKKAQEEKDARGTW